MHDYRALRIPSALLIVWKGSWRLNLFKVLPFLMLLAFSFFLIHIYFIKTQQKDRSAHYLLHSAPATTLLGASACLFTGQRVSARVKRKHNLIKLQFGFHNKLILTTSRNSKSQNAVPTRRSIMLLENKSF